MNGNTRIQTHSRPIEYFQVYGCIYAQKTDGLKQSDDISKTCAMEILDTCLAWLSGIGKGINSQTWFNRRNMTGNMDTFNDHWFSANIPSVLCSPRARFYSNCCALCRTSSLRFALIIIPSMASGNPFRSIHVMG